MLGNSGLLPYEPIPLRTLVDWVYERERVDLYYTYNGLCGLGDF